MSEGVGISAKAEGPTQGPPTRLGMGGARLAGHHVCVGGRWVRVQRGRPRDLTHGRKWLAPDCMTVGRHVCVGGSRVRVLCQGRGVDPSDLTHGGEWLLPDGRKWLVPDCRAPCVCRGAGCGFSAKAEGATQATSHTAGSGCLAVRCALGVGGRWVRVLCQGRGADPGTSHTAGNGEKGLAPSRSRFGTGVRS